MKTQIKIESETRNIGYIKSYKNNDGNIICRYWNNDGDYLPLSKESILQKNQWDQVIEKKKSTDEKIRNGEEVSNGELDNLKIFSDNLRGWQEYIS